MTEFERPRYVAGRLLTAEDLELEQRYHIEKRWLLNRMLHGAGVVSGLAVVPSEQGKVTVEPGFALDPYGREILVIDPQQLAIPELVEPSSICLRYREIETERGTTRETFELEISTACVPEDAVVLSIVESATDADNP
jgi:hypothetical protein